MTRWHSHFDLLVLMFTGCACVGAIITASFARLSIFECSSMFYLSGHYEHLYCNVVVDWVLSKLQISQVYLYKHKFLFFHKTSPDECKRFIEPLDRLQHLDIPLRLVHKVKIQIGTACTSGERPSTCQCWRQDIMTPGPKAVYNV